jgi:hypothetical protein
MKTRMLQIACDLAVIPHDDDEVAVETSTSGAHDVRSLGRPQLYPEESVPHVVDPFHSLAYKECQTVSTCKIRQRELLERSFATKRNRFRILREKLSLLCGLCRVLTCETRSEGFRPSTSVFSSFVVSNTG